MTVSLLLLAPLMLVSSPPRPCIQFTELLSKNIETEYELYGSYAIWNPTRSCWLVHFYEVDTSYFNATKTYRPSRKLALQKLLLFFLGIFNSSASSVVSNGKNLALLIYRVWRSGAWIIHTLSSAPSSFTTFSGCYLALFRNVSAVISI